ncbi:hypothetical protein LTT02_12650 [Mycolicibacterium smegmatis]|uniref:hypothetical protein n=1 Tax=Mycolicibacterium smegmatis TaxID=1772 RepID=UPI0005D92CA6|nr:hypothetical protein [Mycolicibacterium smegmatis]MCP2627392.1 hypothetical protein [Mycolicibacterium smegmatis]MDF1903087.1 hypothetical protein [Mycolicibacterium smegmatis]MDF1909426.1 hypothetical protein [Mycolicibacterium smegmatis]MDF1921542.1 hypothetical protein [Mycolicibacterium smegmatis]MDF1927872.1 hypothetical protein [Mycolicibacterium smegmatis]
MAEPTERRAPGNKHWGWFAAVLIAMLFVGFAVAVVAMLPLAMATDACHEGTTDRVCQLSGHGQNVLVFIPWMSLAAGGVTAVVAAGVANHFKRSPLFGLPVGVLSYLAMIPIGFWLAFVV